MTSRALQNIIAQGSTLQAASCLLWHDAFNIVPLVKFTCNLLGLLCPNDWKFPFNVDLGQLAQMLYIIL